MYAFKISMAKRCKLLLAIVFVLVSASASDKSSEIVVQNMKMDLEQGQTSFSEELLPGEIAGTVIHHVAYVGPRVVNFELSSDSVDMFVFIKGNGLLKADNSSYDLVPESMAIPMSYKKMTIEILEGEQLHYVRFSKELSAQDKEDIKGFPLENKYDMFFTRFSDCEPYTEKIKSPNTVSRTVLPGDIIPRVALGTVKAPGPDEVGAHKHAMLDQLFLGLATNDITAYADDKSAAFTEFSLLHIPIGASHWVKVDENKMMYYLWMDFFLTKEGQEWLKTHKPIPTEKNAY